MIHLWHYLGLGWLRGVDATAAAALGAGNPPACGVRAVLVLWHGCKRFRGTCKAQRTLWCALQGLLRSAARAHRGAAALGRRSAEPQPREWPKCPNT